MIIFDEEDDASGLSVRINNGYGPGGACITIYRRGAPGPENGWNDEVEEAGFHLTREQTIRLKNDLQTIIEVASGH